MNPFNRNAALWIVIVLLLALLYSVFQGGTNRVASNTVSYSDFVHAVDQRQVQDVSIRGNTITGTFREPRNGIQKFATYAPSTPPDEQLMPNLIKNVDRASRASNNPEVQRNADGSVDLYVGSKAPAGQELNWIPTDPARKFELMFRLYGPKKEFFDKVWKLPDVEKVSGQ